jgi:UDP-N-acetylmuramoylalanine--D-glutamate ligase
MTWEEFRSKRVALLGAGIENLSLIEHLDAAGATIFVCDQKEQPLSEDFRYRFPNVKVVTGDRHMHNLGSYDFVFRSPGLPIERVEKALKGSKTRPVVTSATDLFLHMTDATVVGVTGTKGKGTTSTMIGSILEAAGRPVVVAGNIGKPIFSIIKELTKETVVVLELSSFQLEDIRTSPHLAVILPIGEDHLRPLSEESPNYHKSLNDYVAAKAHITLFQSAADTLVFAADSPDATAIASVSKAKKIGVSQSAYQNHWNVGARGDVFRQGEKFCDLAETQLRGQHVFLNATMAAAVATELGVDKEMILAGLKKFVPLPHRLQEIATRNGIAFIDDSYATNPEATIAALTAFTEPVVLIAGGSSKGADFTTLAEKIAQSSVVGVVLVGQEAPRLRQAILSVSPELTIEDGGTTMIEIVTKAVALVKSGGVVLLSPACASKDMFKNAADRGDQYQAAVKALG